MRVYQAADGSWIFFDGVTKFTGLTKAQAEAMMTLEELKKEKIEAVQTFMSRLADIDDFIDVLAARQMGHGQANAPTADDLAEYGLVLTDWQRGIMLLQNLQTLFEGGAPTTSTLYADQINRWRTDV